MRALPDLRSDLCRVLPALVADELGRAVEVHQKGNDGLDLVTSVDFALQARLTEVLGALTPGVPVFGEEGFSEPDTGDGHWWLFDPLDGTVNFAAGLPFYGVAVCLMEGREAQLAAVHDIRNRVTYSAALGYGAACGSLPLCLKHSSVRLAALSSGLLSDFACNAPAALARLLQTYKLRNLGSQALQLCYTAQGRLAFVASREAKGWDDIAGALIARETGLAYGHYGPPPTEFGADQVSLCAPGPLFEILLPQLAESVLSPT